ncbi:hypothetical protein Sinac_4226 [Singulisphaera acidiphila DSM 18658]|uniref:Uncharacterized protein n=1 Tax=Singulisphaera acidiphila (strain ATCC BAA-1392 / DSM 18658 / VKM B-2454 / MOB10) TaxID=886293 RepID=L0DGD4_SINAD|nr:hypothetical protein Sinac_4226 [Singulisphaera acidiphila DSM 18658]
MKSIRRDRLFDTHGVAALEKKENLTTNDTNDTNE